MMPVGRRNYNPIMYQKEKKLEIFVNSIVSTPMPVLVQDILFHLSLGLFNVMFFYYLYFSMFGFYFIT